MSVYYIQVIYNGQSSRTNSFSLLLILFVKTSYKYKRPWKALGCLLCVINGVNLNPKTERRNMITEKTPAI